MIRLFLVLASWGMLLQAPLAAGAQNPFPGLAAQMVTLGFNPAQIKPYFQHAQTRFEGKILARMLSARESKLNYRQFLTVANQRETARYMGKHLQSFNQSHRRFEVEPQVVASIISVESRLGRYTGKHLVFNVLASQAILDALHGKKKLAAHWPSSRLNELDSSRNRLRFSRRAQWAREELAGLLIMAQQEKADPFSYKGSPAGAMGLGQFMPTSALIWGVDGDGDGRVNLYKAKDAIFSVSYYLKDHGWRTGLSREDKQKVIKTYNKSTPYARTVLELADKLKSFPKP